MKIIDGKPEYSGAVVSLCYSCLIHYLTRGHARVGWVLVSFTFSVVINLEEQATGLILRAKCFQNVL